MEHPPNPFAESTGTTVYDAVPAPLGHPSAAESAESDEYDTWDDSMSEDDPTDAVERSMTTDIPDERRTYVGGEAIPQR